MTVHAPRSYEDARAIYIERVRQLDGGVSILVNPGGTGKTAISAGILKLMKDGLGKRIVTIGTKTNFTEAFGEYDHLTDAQFVQQLKIINYVVSTLPTTQSREEERALFMDKLKEVEEKGLIIHHTLWNRPHTKTTEWDDEIPAQKVVLLGSMQFIDEPKKYIDPKEGQQADVKAFALYITQIRHLVAFDGKRMERSGLLMATPRLIDINPDARNQLTWIGRTYCSCRRSGCEPGCDHRFMVQFREGTAEEGDSAAEQFQLNFDGPGLWRLYNSYTLPGFRAGLLDRIRL